MVNDLLPDSIFDGIGGPKAKEIAQFYLLHPKMTSAEIADHFGVSQSRVWNVLSGNRFFRALKLFASNKIKLSSTKAANTLIECLDSNSEDVRLKSATKILENEGILGPQKIEVEVNEIKNLPLSKLIELASQPIDPSIIEAGKKENPNDLKQLEQKEV